MLAVSGDILVCCNWEWEGEDANDIQWARGQGYAKYPKIHESMGLPQ